MAAPVKLNFKLYQGATFRETLRWESSTKAYRPITAITKSAPVQITAVGHGIPEGWRFKVTNVAGMKEINSNDTYHSATVVDADNVSVNAVNTLGFSDYVSGGVIEYNVPVDLASVTARMQIREKLDSTDPILELTTENSGIVVDNVNKTISLFISDTATAALNFTSAVYSVELIKSGDVIPFITGNISLVKEVTR
jgi:hypothetical protein